MCIYALFILPFSMKIENNFFTSLYTGYSQLSGAQSTENFSQRGLIQSGRERFALRGSSLQC